MKTIRQSRLFILSLIERTTLLRPPSQNLHFLRSRRPSRQEWHLQHLVTPGNPVVSFVARPIQIANARNGGKIVCKSSTFYFFRYSIMTASTSTGGTALLTSERTARSEFKFSAETFDVDDDDSVYELKEIVSLTWNIYGVSVLFGFQHNDKTVLKLYGKCLREEVAANLPHENVTYSVNLSVTKNILVPDFMCVPAIKVDVYAKKIDQEDSAEKSIYRGILFSWKANSSLNASNSIKLPLLLCRGTRSCMKVVHSALSRMFDCLIIKLPIEEDDLMWLLPIIIIPITEEEYPNESKQVRLEYLVPGLPNTDTITITLYSSDLVKILNVIIKNPCNETTSAINLTIEHVTKFRECLRAHILKVAGLQLGLCTLHRINVPAGALMSNKMKISDPRTMQRVLLYITEKASEMFHTILF